MACSCAPTSDDPEALRPLLERHVPMLRAFLRLRMNRELRSLEESSDLVQTVCRELLDHEKGFTYRGEAEFRAWLCTAARNKLQERERFWRAQRREARKRVPLASDAELGNYYASFLTPSRVAMGRESVERFERAFEQLSAAQQEVVLLSRLCGLSHREVAEQTGSTEIATRSLLHRALVRLSGLLGDGKEP